ncbi:hypothetical protein GOODEAATRI_000493, partial [Goodea atripinnis]
MLHFLPHTPELVQSSFSVIYCVLLKYVLLWVSLEKWVCENCHLLAITACAPWWLSIAEVPIGGDQWLNSEFPRYRSNSKQTKQAQCERPSATTNCGFERTEQRHKENNE